MRNTRPAAANASQGVRITLTRHAAPVRNKVSLHCKRARLEAASVNIEKDCV